MKTDTIASIVNRLEDLFKQFNERFYNGELQTPVITVSPDMTKGAYGWCTSWKAWQTKDSEGEGFYEINMCAEHLNRDFNDLCGTLLHEMVHLWNLQNNVQDTSRSGMYHNKKFKVEAEQRGLIIEQGQKYGWHITSLNADSIEMIGKMSDTGFDLYRSKTSASASSSKKSSTRKYICPNCGMIVRATKEVRVLCGECSDENVLVVMECEGGDE